MSCRLSNRHRHAARIFLATLSVSALVATSACSSSDAEATGTEPTQVTVAVPAPSELFNLPLVLAERLGYYREAGLEVELVDVGSGSNALQALLAGEADIASGFGGHPISMAAKGQAVRTFVTLLDAPAMVLATSPKTHRKISSVADLAGATVGVSAPGSGTHHLLNFLLSQQDLAPDDVSVAGIGLAASAVAAMEQGQVDAAVMVDPALSQLQARTEGVDVLFDGRTVDGVQDAFGTDRYSGISVYAKAGWLTDNSPTATKMASALTRALRWAAEHTPAEIADAMPAEYAGNDRALYETTIETVKPTFSADGRTYPEGADALYRLLALSVPEVGTADIDLPATYTNEFIEAAAVPDGS